MIRKGDMRKTSVLAILVVVVLAVSASAGRLPANAYPESYQLTFYPDLKAATFRGEEAIQVLLKTPSATITLNSVDLEYQAVMAHLGKKTLTATVATDPPNETATFTFPEKLPAGKVMIHVHLMARGACSQPLRRARLLASSPKAAPPMPSATART